MEYTTDKFFIKIDSKYLVQFIDFNLSYVKDHPLCGINTYSHYYQEYGFITNVSNINFDLYHFSMTFLYQLMFYYPIIFTNEDNILKKYYDQFFRTFSSIFKVNNPLLEILKLRDSLRYIKDLNEWYIHFSNLIKDNTNPLYIHKKYAPWNLSFNFNPQNIKKEYWTEGCESAIIWLIINHFSIL